MRFRESDYDAIHKKANKANMNFTEFVTASAMNKSVNVINGLDEVLKEQKHIGRNINQLTTLCNMGKINCPDLAEVKLGFADIITKLEEIARGYGLWRPLLQSPRKPKAQLLCDEFWITLPKTRKPITTV
ncbi:MAG: MobC family plasmid mobilization relaxosome protein [Clostridia bacterium]|nr:MobC family plasmid mobilization relaxosome protein [Clostridia bacterium]